VGGYHQHQSIKTRSRLSPRLLVFLFKQKGFSIRVDHKDIDSIPIQMDTSWFVRYQFPIYLTTDVIMMIDNISIDGVDVKGTIEDLEGELIHEYEEEIRQ